MQLLVESKNWKYQRNKRPLLKVRIQRHKNNLSNVVLVSLLTLNRFHRSFWYLHFGLLTSAGWLKVNKRKQTIANYWIHLWTINSKTDWFQLQKSFCNLQYFWPDMSWKSDFFCYERETRITTLSAVQKKSLSYGKIASPKNFEKFTEKHLSQSIFLNKVAGCRPVILLKRDSHSNFLLRSCRNFSEQLLFRAPVSSYFL